MAQLAVRNEEDALDIVQDTMLTLAQKYATRPQAEWPPLFFRILKNKITDVHRKRTLTGRIFAYFQRTGDDGEVLDPVDSAAHPVHAEPDQRLRSEDTGQAIAEAVAALPDRQREAFMFRAWQGLDVKQTASAMGCSEGSVKTHYSRAVHTLRDQLEDYR